MKLSNVSIMCFFQNAPTDVVKAVYEVSFDPVVRIVLQSDDHSEMQVTYVHSVSTWKLLLTYASVSITSMSEA